MSENYSDILVIGAGASALMFGANIKQSITFLEANSYFGAKLKVSGGGKCNITNKSISSKNYHGDEEFTFKTLSDFTAKDTLDFLKKYDVYPKIKNNNQYFCNSSKDVLNIFNKATSHHDFSYNTKVLSAEYKNDKFLIQTDKGIFACKKLVVASGGISFTNLGASDIGYKIAQNFGHTITKLSPALVGLTLQKKQFWMKDLSGVSCLVEISHKEHKYKENLLFSHKGISGPAVLNISLRWEKEAINIDFLPELNLDLNSKIWSEKRQLTSILTLPKRVTKEYLKSIELVDKPLKNYNHEEKQKVLKLKNYTFSPAGTFGFSKAEVTKGGVCTDEVDNITFESKKRKNLYFIGEVLNITGELGGYNIQWAFSSAMSCAKNLK